MDGDGETRIPIASLSYGSIFKVAALAMFFGWMTLAILAFVLSYADEGPTFNGKPVEGPLAAIGLLTTFLGLTVVFSAIFAAVGALALKLVARGLDFGVVAGRSRPRTPADPFVG